MSGPVKIKEVSDGDIQTPVNPLTVSWQKVPRGGSTKASGINIKQLHMVSLLGKWSSCIKELTLPINFPAFCATSVFMKLSVSNVQPRWTGWEPSSPKEVGHQLVLLVPTLLYSFSTSGYYHNSYQYSCMFSTIISATYLLWKVFSLTTNSYEFISIVLQCIILIILFRFNLCVTPDVQSFIN